MVRSPRGWRAGEAGVGTGGRGVPPSTTNLLDVNNNNYCNRFFACRCFSRSPLIVRVRFQAAVPCLFAHLLLVYCHIVFIWLSTQTKRKLWRLVSLASGREPS